MNGKKAKALRKIVYIGSNPRDRKYVRLKSTGQVINIGDIEEVDDGKGKLRKLPRRRLYRHLKTLTRGIPITKLETFLTNTKAKHEITKTD